MILHIHFWHLVAGTLIGVLGFVCAYRAGYLYARRGPGRRRAVARDIALSRMGKRFRREYRAERQLALLRKLESADVDAKARKVLR